MDDVTVDYNERYLLRNNGLRIIIILFIFSGDPQ